MIYEEWELFDSEDLGISDEFTVLDFEGKCSVNGLMAIAVEYFSPRYISNEIYEISIPTNIIAKAYLLTCGGHPYDLQIASEFFACAFLQDITKEELEGPKLPKYIFKSSYIVIESSVANEYRALYSESSPIWGGFSVPSVSHVSYTAPLDKPIYALPNLKLPTAFHHEVVLRANKDFSVLGRYLALYQMIELSFDYDLVQDIKLLGQDLRNIGKILAQYNHSETARLHRLITKYWKDENTLLSSLAIFFISSNHDSKIEDLLFGYEKDGFPWDLKLDAAKRNAFLTQARLLFDKPSMEKVKCKCTLESLQKAVGFIIYRFRCAIAHASIGECILTLDDEQFIYEKAEPLLMSFISEMYKVPVPVPVPN